MGVFQIGGKHLKFIFSEKQEEPMCFNGGVPYFFTLAPQSLGMGIMGWGLKFPLLSEQTTWHTTHTIYPKVKIYLFW